jgi:mycoredoxin
MEDHPVVFPDMMFVRSTVGDACGQRRVEPWLSEAGDHQVRKFGHLLRLPRCHDSDVTNAKHSNASRFGIPRQVSVVDQPMSDFTVYTTSWCGFCARLKSQLQQQGIGFDEVDIETHPEAVGIVTKINNGNETVPTVVFSDGFALTNPSVSQISERLASGA